MRGASGRSAKGPVRQTGPTVPHAIALGAVLVSLAARYASAHETWLLPDSFRVVEGRPVQLRLVTGQRFPEPDVLLEPSRIASFQARRGEVAHNVDLLGPAVLAVTAQVSLPKAGSYAIGVALHPNIAPLESAVFEQYLREERADKALTQFMEHRPAPDGVVSERYTKFMKTIVQIGEVSPDDDGFKTPLGHRLELIPTTNPADWVAGSEVALEVLLDGHPWPEVALFLGLKSAAATGRAAETKSDANGMAKFRLPDAGEGYIKAHLIRPTNGLERCDWESFWTTLTFEAGGQTGIVDMLDWIRRVHGSADPMAVAGYRIGRAALAALGLRPGSDDLMVSFHCPQDRLYTSGADGIQAATGASVGRMNLELRASGVEDMRAVFTRRSKSQAIIFRLTPRFVAQLRAMKAVEKEALATSAAAMADDQIFSMSAVPPLPTTRPYLRPTGK